MGHCRKTRESYFCNFSELTSLSNLADTMVPEAEDVSNEINETAQDFEKSGESSGFHDLSHDDMDIEKGPVQSLDDFLVDLPIQEEENTSKNLDELDSPTKSSSSSSSSSATVEPSAAASSKLDEITYHDNVFVTND